MKCGICSQYSQGPMYVLTPAIDEEIEVHIDCMEFFEWKRPSKDERFIRGAERKKEVQQPNVSR